MMQSLRFQHFFQEVLSRTMHEGKEDKAERRASRESRMCLQYDDSRKAGYTVVFLQRTG